VVTSASGSRLVDVGGAAMWRASVSALNAANLAALFRPLGLRPQLLTRYRRRWRRCLPNMVGSISASARGQRICQQFVQALSAGGWLVCGRGGGERVAVAEGAARFCGWR